MGNDVADMMINIGFRLDNFILWDVAPTKMFMAFGRISSIK